MSKGPLPNGQLPPGFKLPPGFTVESIRAAAQKAAPAPAPVANGGGGGAAPAPAPAPAPATAAAPTPTPPPPTPTPTPTPTTSSGGGGGGGAPLPNGQLPPGFKLPPGFVPPSTKLKCAMCDTVDWAVTIKPCGHIFCDDCFLQAAQGMCVHHRIKFTPTACFRSSSAHVGFVLCIGSIHSKSLHRLY